MWQKRERIAEIYTKHFSEVEELIPYKVKKYRISSWYLYPLKLRLETLKIDRNRFIEEFRKRGIYTSVHFIPLYRFTYYRKLGYQVEDYPKSEWIFERIISLPIYPSMSDEEVYYAVENVIDIAKKFKR